MSRTHRDRGFTLIAMVVASIIGTFITVVAVATLRTVAAARQSITEVTAATDEIRYAEQLLRRDFLNFYRDTTIERTRLVGGVDETSTTGGSRVILWATSGVPARRGYPEGDVYEVEYALADGVSESGRVLTRRVCPIVTLSRDDENYVAGTGGMLTTIAENVVQFQVQYYDGYTWLDQWPEEQGVLPELVQVTLVGQRPNDPEGQHPIIRSFAVTFPRVAEGLKATLDEEAETEFEDVSPMDAGTGGS